MFISVPFLSVYRVSDGVLHKNGPLLLVLVRNFLPHHFGLLQCAFSAPIGGNLFFSEGVLILAGVIIDNAKYTSIVILIWISNSVVTVAEIISFDFD